MQSFVSRLQRIGQVMQSRDQFLAPCIAGRCCKLLDGFDKRIHREVQVTGYSVLSYGYKDSVQNAVANVRTV
jgi:hypothetical protein